MRKLLTSRFQEVFCAALNLEHYMRILSKPTHMHAM